MEKSPTKITIEYPHGSLVVTEQGVFFEGAELSNEQLYSLVTHKFDHYRIIRETLGLKTGDSLHARMCPKIHV